VALAALVALVALVGLTACSHAVDARLPVNASAPACTTLATKLPKTLLHGQRRSTHPSSPALAAWGDPAIILRCGVDSPGATAAHCETVNGIDWIVQDLSDGKGFTTFGRSPAVEVLVPKHYAPEEFALTGLSSAVATIPQGEHRCS
jgi:hypothetical protein